MLNSGSIELPLPTMLNGIPRVPLAYLEEPDNDYIKSRKSYKDIPTSVHDALAFWAMQGLPPARWLVAILASDLFEAAECAPPAMLMYIPAITCMLVTFYPCMCYGSPEAVAAWCDEGSLHMLDLPSVLAEAEKLHGKRRAVNS